MKLKVNFDLGLDFDSSADEIQQPKDVGIDTVMVNPKRFAQETAADLDHLEKVKDEKNTVNVTAWAVKCFQTWRDTKVDLQLINKANLNSILRVLRFSAQSERRALWNKQLCFLARGS